ncbi:MAG: DUF3794 domain-containing protein, partial [Firmicutes bacterium]|nr:DUF3794 domain-containing protein [Bacillota bacterium]
MEDEEVRKEGGGLIDPPETIETTPPGEAAEPQKKRARTGRTAGKGGGKKGRKNGEKTGAANGRARVKAKPAAVLNEVEAQRAGTGTAGEPTVIVASAPSVSVFQGARLQLAGAGKATAGTPSGAVSQVQQVEQVTRIVKVHRIEATVGSVTARVITGKVLVQGRVNLQIFFVTDDEMVHHLAEEVPFSSMIEIPGAAPGMR